MREAVQVHTCWLRLTSRGAGHDFAAPKSSARLPQLERCRQGPELGGAGMRSGDARQHEERVRMVVFRLPNSDPGETV